LKNISLLLNAVLIVAVGILYFFQFNGNQKAEGQSVKEESNTPQQENAEMLNKDLLQVVAFINTDSIFAKYELAIQMKEDLEAEEERLTKQLQSKESQFMSEYEALQRNAANMSQFEGQMKQQELLEKQQALVDLQDRYSLKLSNLEQEKNQELNVKIRSFLEGYSKDKPYEVVLSYNEMGIIRWGDKKLDITNEVIRQMNEQYKAGQAATTNK
tara:strand:- start:2304 stop:2945 length:642 start_codon:yes stop_codon:yes gene_type:complete